MTRVMAIFLLGLCSWPTFAVTATDLQREWEKATYQLQGDAQLRKFESLVAMSEFSLYAKPQDPELLIWDGIIKSTFASKAKGLPGLALIKEARTSLETAMKIDHMALKGSAYSSLGALYYQVPKWPIAFGNDKKARALLEKAVSIDPDGIDSNFFYGQFLAQKHDYKGAIVALEKAFTITVRPGHELADEGRRREISEILSRIDH